MRITDEKFRKLLDKYLSGNASPEEKAWLDEWYAEYKKEALQHPGTEMPRIRNEIRTRIERKIEAPVYPLSKHGRSRNLWLAVAASITSIIAISFTLLLFNERPDEVTSEKPVTQPEAVREDVPSVKVGFIERSTSKGQKLFITLPDGTTVNLNAESRLKYPEQFDGSTREIFLEGEGYFDVTHDRKKPFIVVTRAVKTIVLGTSFNVKSISGSATEVTLVQGKVNVLALLGKSDSSAVTLHPNQQAIVKSNSTEIIRNNVEVEKYIGWKNNTIYFENTTLKDVVATLGSWYNKEIVLENSSLESCIINAKYRNESLANVLESLHFLLNLEHETRDGKIILKGNGCSGGIIAN